MNISLRHATPADYDFIERVFFTTQRWIIEKLFGWRGDDVERQRLTEGHDFARAQIVAADGRDTGWMIRNRLTDCVEIEGLYILPEFQGKGIGSSLIADAIQEAEDLPVRLSVAKINPAINLYERLGFRAVGEGEFRFFMERPSEVRKNDGGRV